MEAPVAVFASGSGTNLQALLDDPVIRPWIALVVSDRAEAHALQRARTAGVETLVLGSGSPGVFDEALIAPLRERGIDTIALAGFMRVLGPAFVREFDDRILNVHPALLPSFPGAHAVADALAYGAKVTGVTVHLVDEEVDHGPVVFQEAIVVRDDDVWDTLEPRVHEVEHRLLPAAVRALVEGRLKVEGRRVHVLGGGG
ncbi:MAG: phosphoribosylglycinamide formyltransferase [Actinomycetota bacterium]